jgi:putative ABC transport system permease protein
VEAGDISFLSLGLCLLLMAIPLGIFLAFGVKMARDSLVSLARMVGQLTLVGVFLEYLFDLNNGWVNLAWVTAMIVFAAFSVIGSSKLSRRRFILPTLASFTLSTLSVLLYFNAVVVRLDDVLDARYFITVAGMLLGNSLGGNIIGISQFYQGVRRDDNRYRYSLALGATRFEALAPYFRASLTAALRPTVANMATIGLVFLPGMMTGQILGGSSPATAIKYQMAIMVVIFVAVTLSVSLTVLFTVRSSFDPYGILRRDVFRPERVKKERRTRRTERPAVR